jgi:predicted Zn-dependent protease with MMP-like domain
MSPAEFEALVAEALDGIPDEFARYLDNVSVVVEDEPDEEGLYGLYQGIPLSERTHDFAAALPDRISIYRGPLVRDFRSRAQIRRQIRLTVVHEIAHFFGLDERRIRRLGY